MLEEIIITTIIITGGLTLFLAMILLIIKLSFLIVTRTRDFNPSRKFVKLGRELFRMKIITNDYKVTSEALELHKKLEIEKLQGKWETGPIE